MKNNADKKKLIYISHPSGGLEENTKEIAEIVSELYKNEAIYNNFCIVSPVHCFGFMYEDVEYYKGLSFCTDLLMHCDLMLLTGNYEQSRGCNVELNMCKNKNIPYIVIRTVEELKDKLSNNMLIEELLNKL